MQGKLYLVATPIGNLDDITYRAFETLKSVDVIFAEDTRHTGALLHHFNIKKPLVSYHEYSDEKKHTLVLSRILNGENAALCSDAGMPCIADPGQQLVKDAISLGIEVVPIPGANAMLTALIASGISTDQFAFLGFFPRKNKVEEFKKLENFYMTGVYYESPMRIVDTLCALSEVFPDRKIVVARELTKVHEEFIRGTAKEVYDELSSRDKIKGEIVLIIEGATLIEVELTDSDIEDKLKELLNDMSLKSAVKEVCEKYDLPKNRVYEIGKKIKE